MPVISKITGAPFRFWCQKILPAVYDDSLSYYELLCKVVDYLNKVMEDDINVVNLVNELEEFVNNYFDNLDVQQEINNKLDAMAEDGSLIAVIAPHLDPIIEDYEATLDSDLAEYKSTIDDDISGFKNAVNDELDAQDTDIANFKNTVNGQMSAQNTEIVNFKSTVNTVVSQQDSDISVMQSQMSNFLDSYSDIQTFTDLFTATATNGLHYINQTIDLSQPYTDFDELDIYWSYNSDKKVIRVKSADLLADGAYISWYVDKSPDTSIPAPLYITMMKLVNGNSAHTQLTLGEAYSEEWNGLAASDATRDKATTVSEYTAGEVYKIVGITYTTSAELTDIRVGENHKTYATAGDAVRGQITVLKENLNEYIYGGNKVFPISATGTNRFYMLIIKGARYTFTNNTSAACSVNYVKDDGTVVSISGGLNPNIPLTFIADSDEYIGLSGYFNGTGTIEIACDFSSLSMFEEFNGQLLYGELNKGYMFNNKYIATTGDTANYAGWKATDYIRIGSLIETLRITSPSSSNGRYSSFYDENKEQISSFSIIAGVNDIPVPDNAVYIRISNTASAMDAMVIENIIGYYNRVLHDVLHDLEPKTPTIYQWNTDESMVSNAGANYGFHSGGQSNVQKRFSMLVTTDPHGDTVAMERSVQYLNDMPAFDCGVCLGDLQANTFSDNDGTWYTNAIKESDKPWLTIIGNHDVGIGKSVSATGNQEQVYNKFILPNMQYAGVTPTGNSYYYKDFPAYNIRVICLNAYDVDNNDVVGNEYVVARYTEYYSQTQVNWLVTLLNSTPSNYHVMVLTHNTPKGSVKDTSIKFNNRTYSFSPETTQSGFIADILNAWQNGGVLNNTYTCTNTYLDNVVVNADFTSRGTGVLICFLTGHMHVDCIGHITSFMTQNVFTFASTNRGTYQNDWSDLPRADNTKAEDCITSLSVDTTNRVIYINRIGSSVSKWFDVREPSVIQY